MMGVASAYDSGVTGIRVRSVGSLRRDAFAGGQFGNRSNSGSGWIAGIAKQVLHRSALHGSVGTPRSLGIFVTFEVTVVPRIGINDDAGGSVLRRKKGFHAAKHLAIADDDDLAFQVDAHFFQLREVLRATVVGINHVGGDVARRASTR